MLTSSHDPHCCDTDHCQHWQDGDGDCCDCGAPNWCPDEGEDLLKIVIGSQQWKDLDPEERYRRKIIDIENEYLEKMKLHDQRVAIFGVYVVLVLLAIFSIIAYAVSAK
jgi:hypothetical protein